MLARATHEQAMDNVMNVLAKIQKLSTSVDMEYMVAMSQHDEKKMLGCLKARLALTTNQGEIVQVIYKLVEDFAHRYKGDIDESLLTELKMQMEKHKVIEHEAQNFVNEQEEATGNKNLDEMHRFIKLVGEKEIAGIAAMGLNKNDPEGIGAVFLRNGLGIETLGALIASDAVARANGHTMRNLRALPHDKQEMSLEGYLMAVRDEYWKVQGKREAGPPQDVTFI